MINYLKKWDRSAAKRPDVMIAISRTVKDRIKKYYKRDAEIIFPPVGIKVQRTKSEKSDEKPYYLLVSRLDFGYKKVELAIEAFIRMKKRLIVVGTGREKEKLQKNSGKYIKFTGRVPDEKLSEYYKYAKALIMPQEEDFGIVSVEAQSHGIPVIAFGKGGAIDTVIPGRTGILFEEQNPESLIEAVKKFEKRKFGKRVIRNHSQKFSKEIFKKKITRLVRKNFISR